MEGSDAVFVCSLSAKNEDCDFSHGILVLLVLLVAVVMGTCRGREMRVAEQGKGEEKGVAYCYG